jgi:anti-sigma regulatory factor (Ser/Thr protein kinase)
MPLEGIGSQRRWLLAAPDAGAAARREFDDLAGHVEKDVVDRSRLVLTELVTNSVRHAGLGPDRQIQLGLSVRTELVRIEVGDEGSGFMRVAVPPDPAQESGWGLWLVDQLADRWGLDPGPGAHVWCELDRTVEPGKRQLGATRVRQRAQTRGSPGVLGVPLAETDAASYRRAQRQALERRGLAGRGAQRAGAGPLEFDESGFPIPQRPAGFVERAARLLEPY